ncbi:MAG TPA: ATP-binding protein [Saprospiraceae bacterium]|nr:ATP-binding protein [Saprospiraceae bacterium]HMQ83714.1 ATP-binding protein [Saprospiraceae bacterium]
MQPIFVGRHREIQLIKEAWQKPESRFIAVYGRRRVGKTYLIRHTLAQHISFQMSAIANIDTKQQLLNFHTALLRRIGQEITTDKVPENWFMAFQALISYLEQLPEGKKVVFFDELPWFDTKKSDFLQSLEHFWNSWASARQDILLVVCGSAASWMIHNLIRNKGGLHNRVTDRIRLEPFTLAETEAFLHTKNPVLDRYLILQLYMALGGIPYYLDYVNGKESAMQNIERLCFSKDGVLRDEFTFILASLFSHSVQHELILEAMATKNKGLSREEISRATNISNGGRLSSLLQELEESGFIQVYQPFGHKKKNTLYRLSDFYTSFYFKFIKNTSVMNENNWLLAMESGQYRAWSGFAFEQVCLNHLAQIKKALGIQGIISFASGWQSKKAANQAQIDLVLDRRDHMINLFEMKFSVQPFAITKSYAAQLAEKTAVFKEETGTRKTLLLTFITTFGLAPNAYASALVQHDFDCNILYEY